MFKLTELTTPVRFKKKTVTINDNGFNTETWADVINENIMCEWRNKFGSEVYKAAAIHATEPASIRLWYMPNIDETCRVVRLTDNAIFEIVSIDNVSNRNQQLEIELKRYVEG